MGTSKRHRRISPEMSRFLHLAVKPGSKEDESSDSPARYDAQVQSPDPGEG
jgi:hypothetical protein